MTEEILNEQLQHLKEMEQRKQDQNNGVDKIIELIKQNVRDPVERVYFETLYRENREVNKQLKQEVYELNMKYESLKTESDTLKAELKEIRDSINYFASQSLKKQDELNNRVMKTCDVIDREIML